MSGGSVSAVFYADKYHPIQAGSIDGTDVAPHDNAVLRALICSQAGLCACAVRVSAIPLSTYPLRTSPLHGFPSRSVSDDPFGDPKASGDPHRTVFVGRLSRQTDDDTLRKVRPFCPPHVCQWTALLLVAVCWVSRDPHGWSGRFPLLLFVQAMSRYGRVKSMRLVRDIGE
jgi:hypothetical protein